VGRALGVRGSVVCSQTLGWVFVAWVRLDCIAVNDWYYHRSIGTIDDPPLQKFFDGGAAEASWLGFL
jgi:hypothetical protein